MLRDKLVFLWIISGLLALVIVSCGGDTSPSATAVIDAPEPTEVVEPTETPVPPTPTPAPTPMPTLVPTATPLPVLPPSEVFSLVSPSIAFIETQIASGSGVLTEGGYLVTNAHVVHGNDKARVVFPDGSEFLDVPVHNADTLIDLAVLGPIDTDIPTVELVDRENLAIGSELLLVGYPAESENFPQPTITRGILSRIREWSGIRMTYFQTDAALTGGQSGGALVSELGEVIGISGFRFSDAGFGLVASSGDLKPAVDALIRKAWASELGPRDISLGFGNRFQDVTIYNVWDSRRFFLDEPVGTTVDLEIFGDGDGFLAVIDPFGNNVLLQDLGVTGFESGSLTTQAAGRHSVVIGVMNDASSGFTLEGSTVLYPSEDPDDGTRIIVGETTPGNIDSLFDEDYFLLHLDEGQTVSITAESLNIDAHLTIDFPDSRFAQIVSDDDSGIGLFGTDSAVTYKAIQTGLHYIVINDFDGYRTGGYLLSVKDAEVGATAVTIPPSFEKEETSFGTMSVVNVEDSGFSIHVPEDWIEVDGSPDSLFTYAEISGNTVAATSSLVDPDMPGNTLEELVTLFASIYSGSTGGAELLSRVETKTTQGLDAVRIDWSIFDGIAQQSYFMTIDESNRFTTIIIQTVREEVDSLASLVEHIIESYTTTE